jgi:hypothetical protein
VISYIQDVRHKLWSESRKGKKTDRILIFIYYFVDVLYITFLIKKTHLPSTRNIYIQNLFIWFEINTYIIHIFFHKYIWFNISMSIRYCNTIIIFIFIYWWSYIGWWWWFRWYIIIGTITTFICVILLMEICW